MAKHKKPSKEELEENIKKTADELEELKKSPVPTPSEPEPTPSPSVPSKEPEEEQSPSPPEPSKEIYKDVLKREKEKSRASGQEAQVLHARSKKLTEAFEKATDIKEPTEDEMEQLYSDWEMMSGFEKKIAKDNVINERRFVALGEVAKDFKDFDKWQKKVTAFIEDPKALADYPELEGREDEFRLFATKPTRRGVDFKDLVAAFLYRAEKKAIPTKMKKGKMFETGGGGPAGKQKKGNKISLEEAKSLRETDYKKYKEYVQAGKIDTSGI